MFIWFICLHKDESFNSCFVESIYGIFQQWPFELLRYVLFSHFKTAISDFFGSPNDILQMCDVSCYMLRSVFVMAPWHRWRSSLAGGWASVGDTVGAPSYLPLCPPLFCGCDTLAHQTFAHHYLVTSAHQICDNIVTQLVLHLTCLCAPHSFVFAISVFAFVSIFVFIFVFVVCIYPNVMTNDTQQVLFTLFSLHPLLCYHLCLASDLMLHPWCCNSFMGLFWQCGVGLGGNS